MFLECLFLVFPVFLSSASTQFTHLESYDYCDVNLKLCEVPSDHTMCKYPIPGLAAQCTPTVHESLSAIERKRILFWHNKFRSDVATGIEKNKNRKLPTSSNMRQLYWDKELEVIAERWAEQCVSTTDPKIYDKCRNTRRFQVSQNVGTRLANGSSIEKQAPQIVIAWYKEGKDFDATLVDKFPELGEGRMALKQFANIIWADTHAIGCSRIIFQEQLPISGQTQKFTKTAERLVCNYGPGGNEVGKPVYKRGVSCENCPSGTQCSTLYRGLCATQYAEKTETQQSMESQDAKEEESRRVETTSHDVKGSGRSNFIRKLEDSNPDYVYLPEEPLTGTPEAEKTTDCSGDKCPTRANESRLMPPTVNHDFYEIQGSSKPSARKKYEKDNLEFLKEKVSKEMSKGRKAVREATDVNALKEMQNGDHCHCYEINEVQNSSHTARYKLMLLLLASFISIQNFYFHIKII